MSQLEKEQKLAQQEKRMSTILWIPVLVLLTIIPLIVKVSAVLVNGEMATILGTQTYGDFFSQYKSVGIILMVITMFILLFLFFNKQYIKKDKMIGVYSISALVFLIMTILSMMLSKYREVALWGAPDRAEGGIILGCYIVMFLYTIYIFRSTDAYKKVVIALSILIGILTFLGIFQYFGYDLLMKNEMMNKLVLGKKYAHLAGQMSADYEAGRVYGTLFHYNYMGSFGAMMVPIFMVLTLFVKGYKKKLGLGIVAICSLFLLLGSTSRAGLIGLTLSVVAGIIVFGKVIIKKWKWTVPIVGGLVIILVTFNMVTGGAIFERIPTLVQDALGIFMPADKMFDYKDHIPVREIISQEGKVSVVMQAGTLNFTYVEEGLIITDEQGKSITFTDNEGVKVTEDERFNSLQFELANLTENSDMADCIILIFNGRKSFALRVDAEQGVYLVDNYSFEPLVLEEAPYWGFEGKERLGSARGYIWSRSIPMLKETLFLGSGPDTYALEFPQQDLLAKWWAYETPNMVVDKPHNLYLQIALNEGVIALIAFLVLVGAYLVDSLRLYALKSYYESREIIGVATTMGIIGYLGAGIFNDSIVSVAPIFWILLGVGVAINYLNQRQYEESKKRVAHATIDMNTRQHI